MRRVSTLNVPCPVCRADVGKRCVNLKGELAGMPRFHGAHAERSKALQDARKKARFERLALEVEWTHQPGVCLCPLCEGLP